MIFNIVTVFKLQSFWGMYKL